MSKHTRVICADPAPNCEPTICAHSIAHVRMPECADGCTRAETHCIPCYFVSGILRLPEERR